MLPCGTPRSNGRRVSARRTGKREHVALRFSMAGVIVLRGSHGEEWVRRSKVVDREVSMTADCDRPRHGLDLITEETTKGEALHE